MSRMNNLLVGNGINIQFNKNDYTTQSIVLRILEDLDEDDFPSHIIVDEPILQKEYIGRLFLFARKAIEGYFNDYTTCTAEKIALVDFIERYKDKKSSLRITDIGFEDYYLIHDLVCHKYGIVNPEQYFVRESLRFSYLYAIYNRGKLNLLYKQYSDSFKNFLLGFDSIFTTNYDSNIEAATGKEVFHIHGQFDRMSEAYNPESFRNQMNDAPIADTIIDLEYRYLYSTALSTYCGDYKQYQIKQKELANSAVEKLADSYISNMTVRDDVDKWEASNNQLVVNMANAIKLKIARPELRFQEDYPINELMNISGSLTILGLSPYNDYHLFDIIDNADLSECIYYFLSSSERDKVKSIFPKLNASGKLRFRSVENFWRTM